MTKKLSLYKKTHNKTGLQYLGKTNKDPFKYKGSGTIWKRHIDKHGYDVNTEILLETYDHNEIKKTGIYYSELWDIVNSDSWANLKPEEGDGGNMGPAGIKKQREKMLGHANWLTSQTDDAKKAIGEAQKKILSTLSKEEMTERMKNSCCQPESYTAERARKISESNTGVKKTKTLKLLAAETERRNRPPEQKLKCGDYNRGKTWKLINGKRVWITKEN